MEVADEVRHLGKDNGDRLEDALTHIVNQRKRNAVGFLDALQERDDML